MYYYPNPTVHQFRKIIGYDATTKLLTLESAIVDWVGPANQAGTQGCVYLNRIRKGLPILPINSTTSLDYTIPKITSNGESGSIFITNIIESGTNYAVNDVLTVTGATTNAQLTVNGINNNGGVTGLTITFSGLGVTGTTHNPTGGGGSGLKITVGLGIGINIHNTTTNQAIPSTVNGAYDNKIFYCPSYISGSGTATTDPSAAQEFIPQSQTLNVDNTTPYTDVNHCSFKILKHSYDGVNKNVIVVKSVDVVASRFRTNFEYNILDYTSDGINNFINNKYLNVNQLHQQYEIQLLSLTLPNKAIRTGPGGFIANQPFIFVEFYSEGSRNRQLYNTNNPNLESVLFKCIVTDVSNPNSIPFIKLKSDYSVAINFDITKNMHFRVIMPNGEVFRTFSSDSVPPRDPIKELQVSATFSLTPIISDK